MKLNLKKLFAIAIIGAGVFVSQQSHAFMGYDYYMDPTNLPSDTLFLIIAIKQTAICHYCHQLYFLQPGFISMKGKK